MKFRPTKERLDELLRVDINTGEIWWKKSRGRVKAGDRASYRDKNGYVRLTVETVELYAHHIVFFCANGHWPDLIDHINGVRDDNRIVNLREASAATNARNRHGFADKTLAGTRRTPEGRWAASMNADGVFYHLGVHETAELANAAYMNARRSVEQAEKRARHECLFLLRKRALKNNVSSEGFPVLVSEEA